MTVEVKGFVVEKFDGYNFGFWRMQIADYLYQKYLYLPLGRIEDKPNDVSTVDWKVLDRKALKLSGYHSHTKWLLIYQARLRLLV